MQVWQAVYRDLAAAPESITTIPGVLRENWRPSTASATFSRASQRSPPDGQTRQYLF